MCLWPSRYQTCAPLRLRSGSLRSEGLIADTCAPSGLYAPSGAPRGQTATPFALYPLQGTRRGEGGPQAPALRGETACAALRRKWRCN